MISAYTGYHIISRVMAGKKTFLNLGNSIAMDAAMGLATVLFALISSQIGVNLSSEAFYLTIGIGATYAFIPITKLLFKHFSKAGLDEHTPTFKKPACVWFAFGISALALGILGLTIGFLPSDLSYSLMGIGSASLFSASLYYIALLAAKSWIKDMGKKVQILEEQAKMQESLS